MDDGGEQRARELLTAANEGGSAVGAGFMQLVTVAVYIAVTLASTTDDQLVRGDAVTLPLVNTAIPMTGLSGFCTLAPVLILILHVRLLAQLATLRARMTRLGAALSDLTEAQRASVCDRLAAPYYVRFFVSEAGLGRGGSAVALLATMILIPLGLLVWIQVRFLPLHDANTTLLQQRIVVADVAIALVILWSPLSRRAALREDASPPRTVLARSVASSWTLALVLGVALVAFSIIIAIPDGRKRSGWLSDHSNLDLEAKILSEDRLSPEQINTLQDGTPAQREDILRKVSRQSVLQGHDLRHANLRRAILPAVDFRSERNPVTAKIVKETVLEGADLSWAEMQHILLDDVNLRHATLRGARLQGAILTRANLEGADLRNAGLQDSKLSAARLRYAALGDADLAASDLSRADLRDADLTGVRAQSAMFREADLRGADLRDADLRGADLSRAHLQGTKLTGTQLDGAIVRGVVIRDAFGRPCKLRPGSPLASTVEQLTFEGCRARRFVGPACEATESIAAALAGFACGDPYVARGLSTQILYDAPGRYPLVRAMVAAGADEKCTGIRLLSDGVRAGLTQRAQAPTLANE